MKLALLKKKNLNIGKSLKILKHRKTKNVYKKKKGNL